MKTLRKIAPYSESLQLRKNYKDHATVGHLKAMAKHANFSQARFVIHPEGHMTIGDASIHTHVALGGGAHSKTIEGYVDHNPRTDTYSYRAFPGLSANPYAGNHPMFNRFHQHGIVRDRDNMSEYNLNELTKKIILRYINKAQDKDRYFKDPDRLDTRLKSFITAQKKVGIARSQPKIMATGRMNEWVERKPHYNIGINSLKNIAKMSDSNTARFSIEDNKLHGGDSHYFNHDDLVPKWSDKPIVNGYITHNPETGEHHYAAYINNGKGRFVRGQHPLLDKMESHGIKRGILNPRSNEVVPLEQHHNQDDYKIQEAEDLHIIHRYGNAVPVLKNPNIRDARDLHSEVGSEGSIRTLKHGNDLYVWNAHNLIHHNVATDLNIPFNKEAKASGTTQTGYFKRYHLKDNKFDLRATHDKMKDRYSPNGELLESRGWEERKPHINIGINSLKNITKQSVYPKSNHATARFLIQNNKMNAGSGHYFFHDDLETGHGSSVNGYITHHPESGIYHYAAYTNKGNGLERAEHPLLDKMEAHGIKRGILHPDHDEVRAFNDTDDRNRYRTESIDWTITEDEEYQPKKTIKAYKLFNVKGGKLYPLFVHHNEEVPMGKWLHAKSGTVANDKGQVKSKLGPLAYRPGWHSSDLPVATHIGGKSRPSLTKPDYRLDHQAWAEVEHPADHDWQSVANSKGSKAHITDQVPSNGHYRYKTNPNMIGNWIISGQMKVNRLLHDDEVKAINKKAGTADLPRRHEMKEHTQPFHTSPHDKKRLRDVVPKKDNLDHTVNDYSLPLSEASSMFDFHYPHREINNKKIGKNSTHTYEFKSPHDTYHVTIDNIQHKSGERHAHVMMDSKKGGYSTSGAEPQSAHKVFGTLKHIQDEHATKHNINTVHFTAAQGDKESTARNRLYTHLWGDRPNFQSEDAPDTKLFSYTHQSKQNEISTNLLAKYIKKASRNGMDAAYSLGQDSVAKKGERLSTRIPRKRAKGISTAVNKLVQRDWSAIVPMHEKRLRDIVQEQASSQPYSSEEPKSLIKIPKKRLSYQSKSIANCSDGITVENKKIIDLKTGKYYSIKEMDDRYVNREQVVHTNLSTGTLKHIAKNSQSKTMKFYISSSDPNANMYSGDSQYFTHHSLGARGSQIQGAITHHPDTDSFKYQAWHGRDGKNIEATHDRLKNMEKNGVNRGKWNSDEARVE